MRTTLLLIVLVAGCGSKKKDDSGGGGGTAATTPPPAADAAPAMAASDSGAGSAVAGPPCVKADPDNELAAFDHADDKSVTFCIDKGAVRDCFVVDLASGEMQVSKPPAEHPKPEWHSEQDAKG